MIVWLLWESTDSEQQNAGLLAIYDSYGAARNAVIDRINEQWVEKNSGYWRNKKTKDMLRICPSEVQTEVGNYQI